MDGFVEIRVGSKTYRSLRDGLAATRKQLNEGVEGASVKLPRIMREALQLVAKRMEERHSSPWRGTVRNPSDDLQRRSGRGLRSIRNSIRVRGAFRIDQVQGEISTADMGAIHEEGGTIRAKNSNYLTIPLPAAMDSRGIPLRRRARDWDQTFVARSRRGNLLIFRKRLGGQVEPLYLLKPSVYIRPRLGLGASVINDALPYFERQAIDVIADNIAFA